MNTQEAISNFAGITSNRKDFYLNQEYDGIQDKLKVLSSQSNVGLYYVDMEHQIIESARNLEQLLGYSSEAFDYQNLFDIIHPDDREAVYHIVRTSLDMLGNNEISPRNELHLTYRVRKSDGSYAHILRKSGILNKRSSKGGIIHYSIIEDISFMNIIRTISYSWVNPDHSCDNLNTRIKQTWRSNLTKTEKKIIQLLQAGLTYAEIAEQQFISISTVKKHMHNILKKTDCRNSKELLNYCNHHYNLIF